MSVCLVVCLFAVSVQ